MARDVFELYKLYLFALRTREEFGEQYGDTEEMIKMYEEELKKEGVIPMTNKFEEVSNDIINMLSSLHYDDREKEIHRLKIVYVLCKMVESEQIFNNDTKILDEGNKKQR